MGRGFAHIAVVSAALWGALVTPALAQDAAADRALDLNTAQATERLIDMSSVLQGFDGLDLGLSDDICLSDVASCYGLSDPFTSIGAPSAEAGRLDYARAFRAGGFIGLDLELEPRAGLRFSESEDSALVGAIVRIGEDLKAGEVQSKSWYLFAGADAEAMHYTPGSLRGFTSGDFALGDRVIVGDAQAGIGYRLGRDADVSLGYYYREISSLEDNDPSNDFSISEDAAAISFTWRR